MTLAAPPAHVARVLAALNERSIAASQNGDPNLWESKCPGCGTDSLMIRDVLDGDDDDTRRKVRLHCPTCLDDTVLRALGLRGHELLLDLSPSSAAAGPADVTFLSPDELLASVPPEPPWVMEGYLAANGLTVLAGKPKAGKSTLGAAIAKAVCGSASEFLGRRVMTGPVVYVSEEGAATLAHKVAGDTLRIATRDTAWPRPDWVPLIAAAKSEAQRVGAVLLVFDTFAFWAGLGPESEKDAGAVQAAMEPLVGATRAGIAVLLIVHARKGGGEDGDAVRGSSALAGAADIVLELDRVPDGSARQRKVLALSRYPQTPGVLVVDHDASNGSWRVIGEGTDRGDARDIGSRTALLDALANGELTRKELEEVTGKKSVGWHSTMEQLIASGDVVRLGAGVKGDAHRFRIVPAVSEQNPGTNGSVDVADAAAYPEGGQHQKQDTLELLVAASDAETIDAFPGADAEYDRVASKFPDLGAGNS